MQGAIFASPARILGARNSDRGEMPHRHHHHHHHRGSPDGGVRLRFDVVVCANPHVGEADEWNGPGQVLDPGSSPDMPPPTSMRVWLDPFWEGVWCSAEALRGDHAVFSVDAVLRPLKPASMMPQMEDGADARRTLVSSVKLQFFSPFKRPNCLPEFRFASGMPLAALGGAGDCVHLGAWNCNSTQCCNTGDPLRSWLITVRNAAPVSVPSDAALLRLPSPDPQHFARVRELSTWLKAACDELFPDCASVFTETFTCLRGPWALVLSQDLHLLHTTPDGGSPLPPALACYALANALIVHAVPLADMQALLLAPALAGDQAAAERLVRLVRDVLMCCTLCAEEGVYRADTVRGRAQEDQPFAFSFRPPADEGSSDTGDLRHIFDAGDCEDRSVQGCVMMRQLLESMGRDSRTGGLKRTLAALRLDPAGLQVGAATLEALARAAAALGMAFIDGALCARMCVGDCSFSRLDRRDGGPRDLAAPLDGHAYGLLTFAAGAARTASIMETTTWTISGGDTDDPLVREAAALAKAGARPRRQLTDAQAAGMYIQTISGDSGLFFTDAEPYPTLGADMHAIRKGVRAFRHGGRPSRHGGGTGGALTVCVGELLKAMDPATPPGPWPKVAGAGVMAESYRSVRELYPFIARALRPPAESEAAILRRMRAGFGVITEAHLALASSASGPAIAAVAYSASQPVPPAVAAWQAKCGGEAHPCMGSIIVLARPPRIGGAA